MQPRPPDFIGIGAQKAGTWWLRTQLARHPGVWMPPVAELHYFDRPLEGAVFPPATAADRLADSARLEEAVAAIAGLAKAGDFHGAAWRAAYEFLDQDDDWYRMLFAPAAAASVVGEITPRYAICGDAEIAHMHAVAPAAKLVFLLRHPVHRFWAQCKMMHGFGTLQAGDAAAMRLFDSSNGRPRGEYTRTIARYCRRYDPAQVLIAFQDGLARQPREALRAVFGFLGLADVAVDDAAIHSRVNETADPRPIPDSLRTRIEAAYRAEMEALAEVFGGYAAGWLDGSPPHDAAPVVQLTAAHVDAIERRPARVRAARTRPPCRVFCVSMQRSGTTSVGDWLEAHGLVRAGSPTAVRLGWTRLWFEGRHEEIFAADEFGSAEILEDDPWWCPGFHRHLAARFPDAKFILLTRDPDDWFASLCHHGGGMNPGWSDIHARIYDREEELQELLRSRPGADPAAWGLLSIVEHADHYKRVYERHTAAVQECFAAAPERLFSADLEAPGTFHEICEFVGVRPNPRLAIPKSNARTDEMSRRLAARLAGGVS